MLFGTERVLNLIYSDLKKIEDDYHIVVVFGATVDGVAMGVTKYSSDLDLRFCFLYKDRPLLRKEEYHDEKKIRIQVKFEQTAERPYDAVTLWEAHAFFHFVSDPQINQGYKYRLATIVYDTFCSPYLYDPYGLYAKIQPYFYKAYQVENEKRNLCSQLLSFCEKETYTLADTLKAINKLMRLKWIGKYKTLPPISSYTLLKDEGNDIQEKYDELMTELAQWSKDQQKLDDRTKDKQIEKPIEVCNIIDRETDGIETAIDYSVYETKNVYIDRILAILDDINTSKYPPPPPYWLFLE